MHVLMPMCVCRSAAFGGVRQWLERKAGTIRQKMMGKRVNYAARTVLAPDALIGTNEVGIPLEFAMKLSIPEKVRHVPVPACIDIAPRMYRFG